MKIGYIRVSTQEQNLDLQLDALNEAGCEKIFRDKVTGAKSDRPGLDEALSHLRKGDTLIVWRLDRLGRNSQHLINTVEDLHKKGVGFKTLQEGISADASSTGKLIFNIFASMAQFERDLISERTKAGLKAARSRGKLGGRKKKLNDKKLRQAKAMYDAKTMSVTEICETLGVSRPTFYKYIRPEEEAEAA